MQSLVLIFSVHRHSSPGFRHFALQSLSAAQKPFYPERFVSFLRHPSARQLRVGTVHPRNFNTLDINGAPTDAVRFIQSEPLAGARTEEGYLRTRCESLWGPDTGGTSFCSVSANHCFRFNSWTSAVTCKLPTLWCLQEVQARFGHAQMDGLVFDHV